MMKALLIAVCLVCSLGVSAIMPDLSYADTVEVFTYGNGAIMEKIFLGVALFSNTSANSLLKFTAIVGLLLFMWSIMSGDGKPQAHFIHFLIVMLLYLGMFIPKVSVTILDQTRAPGSLVNFTSTVSNVPAGLGYLASLTSRMGKRLTEVMETSFSEPGYLNYARYGLALGPQAITITPNYPARELMNMKNYLVECFNPMLTNGYGTPAVTTKGLVESSDLLSYITPSREVQNLTVQYQPDGLAPETHTCGGPGGAYGLIRQDMTTWLNNNGAKDMAARMGLANQAELLNILGPAYFAYTGMNVAATDVIQQRVMFQAFKQSMTGGAAPGSSDLMGSYAFEANRYSMEQATIQVTAKMFRAYLPIFRSVYQAILFGLFPVVLAMAFVNTGYTKIIGVYARHMIWIELWDPVFAIHNYVAYLYQSQTLKSQFTNSGMTFFNLSSSSQIDEQGMFNYAVVLLTAPIAVSFAYFIASATESIGEGVLTGVASRVSSGAGVGGGEGLAGKGVYQGATGSLTDQHIGSSSQYGLNDHGELERISSGMHGGSSMRTPVNMSSVGRTEHQGALNELKTTSQGGGEAVSDVRMPDSNNLTSFSMGGDSLTKGTSLSTTRSSGESGSVSQQGQVGTSSSEGVRYSESAGLSDRAGQNASHVHGQGTGTESRFGVSFDESTTGRQGEAARISNATSLNNAIGDAYETMTGVRAGIQPSLPNAMRSLGKSGGGGGPQGASPGGPAPNTGTPSAPSVPGAPNALGNTFGAPVQSVADAGSSGSSEGSISSGFVEAMKEYAPAAFGMVIGGIAGAATGGAGAIPAGIAARSVSTAAISAAARASAPMMGRFSAAFEAAGPAGKQAIAKQAANALAATAALIGPSLSAQVGGSHSNSQSTSLSDSQMQAIEAGASKDESVGAILSRAQAVSARESTSSDRGFQESRDASLQQSTDAGKSIDRTAGRSMSGSRGSSYNEGNQQSESLSTNTDLARKMYGESRGSGERAAAMGQLRSAVESGDAGRISDVLSSMNSPTASRTSEAITQKTADASANQGLSSGAPTADQSPLAPAVDSNGKETGRSAVDQKIGETAVHVSEKGTGIKQESDGRRHDFGAHAHEAPISVESRLKSAGLESQYQDKAGAIRSSFQDIKDHAETGRSALWEKGKGQQHHTAAKDLIDKYAPGLAPTAHQVTPSGSSEQPSNIRDLQSSWMSTPSSAGSSSGPSGGGGGASGHTHGAGAHSPATSGGPASSSSSDGPVSASSSSTPSARESSASGPGAEHTHASRSAGSSASSPTPSSSDGAVDGSGGPTPGVPNSTVSTPQQSPQVSSAPGGPGSSSLDGSGGARVAQAGIGNGTPSGPDAQSAPGSSPNAASPGGPGGTAPSSSQAGGATDQTDEARRAFAAMDHSGHGHPGQPHPGTDIYPSQSQGSVGGDAAQGDTAGAAESSMANGKPAGKSKPVSAATNGDGTVAPSSFDGQHQSGSGPAGSVGGSRAQGTPDRSYGRATASAIS